ncbi:hypothetical protein [Rosenbergiella australiborealis]|uniref:hypothetical protein n=1 Tax=Rosenbergiella australiborealis TaxID=1544696 RepID=UPI001F4E952E|nr:hypothetical protein [Rosenbergiella australiborealis]
MSEANSIVTPKLSTASSVFCTPDKEYTIITFYQHEFKHVIENSGEQAQFRVEARLATKESLCMSNEQAIALAKSLKTSLEGMGLWKE